MAQIASSVASHEMRPASETCSVEVAAARLGLSRSKAYELARRDELGVPILRFGRKLAIPTRALDRVLGIDDTVTLAEHGTEREPAEARP